jgi:GMP synthase-like glutamine amidotransferase
MRFHCLQHVVFEKPGIIETWIREKGYPLSYTHFFADQALPSLQDKDAILILGGPMSVHDELAFPWLKKEKEWIGQAIRQNKKIMGICLGAQLIAEVLGAKVYINPEKEIGFLPVFLSKEAKNSDLLPSLPAYSRLFHWHGETFELPRDAILLASSEACACQAYRLANQILCFQFHPELNGEIIRDMIIYEGQELVSAAYVHTREKIMEDIHHLEFSEKWMRQVLDIFFADQTAHP